MKICKSNLEALGFEDNGYQLITKYLDCDLEIEFDTSSKELSIVRFDDCPECGGQINIPVYLDTMKELKTLIKFLEGHKIKIDRNTTQLVNMTKLQYKTKLAKGEILK